MVTLADPSPRPGHTDLRGLLGDGAQDGGHDQDGSARDFTIKALADMGYKCTDSQTNFMFVNIGTPAKGFREACRAKGVLVARDFPPFDKPHCRITLGTMEEMQKALAVFGEVLGQKATAA